MGSGTVGYRGFGTSRSLELPEGDSAPVAPAGRARFRYNKGSMAVEVSVDEGAYQVVATGPAGASPWVDDGGGNIREQNVANDVVIGAGATVGTEKLRVVGDIRVESQVQVTELTSVPGSGLDLEVSSDTGDINVAATGTQGLRVVDGIGDSKLQVDATGNQVVLGTSGVALDIAQFYATKTELNIGSDASALDIKDGSDSRVAIDTVAGTISFGTSAAPQTANVYGDAMFEVPTSNANAWRIVDDTGREQINIDTTPAAESVSIGNATTNPHYSFVGSGDVRISSQVRYTERTGDPTAVANNGFTYTKDVAGTTEYFYRDSAGNIVQITSGGAVVAGAGGANTQVQYNNGGVLDGGAAFVFDGTNVTTSNALFSDGGLDRSGAAALAIAETNATSVAVGTALHPITTTITVPDNQASVFKVVDDNGDGWIDVTSTDFSEGIEFGHNNVSGTAIYAFNGTAPWMVVGSDGSGVVNCTEIGPQSFDTNHTVSIGVQSECTGVTLGQSGNALTVDSQLVTVAAGDVVIGAAATVGVEVLRVVGNMLNTPSTISEFAGAVDLSAGRLAFTADGVHLAMIESTADPGATANYGKVYTKDVTANTELFFQDSSGNVVQITSGGAVNATASAAGSPTEVQFNTGGAFDASSGLTFDDTPDRLTVGVAGAGEIDVTNIRPNSGGGGHDIFIGNSTPVTDVTIGAASSAITIGGGLNLGSATGATVGTMRTQGGIVVDGNIDKTSASTISIGSGTALSIFISRTGQLARVLGSLTCDETLTSSGPFTHLGGSASETFAVNLPDNVGNVFTVGQSGFNYIEIDTTNTAELLALGVNAVNPSVTIATASGKIGVFGATAVVQQTPTGVTTGFTAGSGTPANDDSTYTGNIGASAFTVGDLVAILKTYGWLPA